MPPTTSANAGAARQSARGAQGAADRVKHPAWTDPSRSNRCTRAETLAGRCSHGDASGLPPTQAVRRMPFAQRCPALSPHLPACSPSPLTHRVEMRTNVSRETFRKQSRRTTARVGTLGAERRCAFPCETEIIRRASTRAETSSGRLPTRRRSADARPREPFLQHGPPNRKTHSSGTVSCETILRGIILGRINSFRMKGSKPWRTSSPR